MQVLETQRLVLREIEAADAPFILELHTDPSFLANIGDRGVHDLPSAVNYIETNPRASYARNGYGLWLVVSKETGESLGMAGIVRRDTLPDADIGYAFLPRHWSKGYAVEACTAVRDHAMRTLALPRLLAIVSPGNAASVKVLERIGLTFRDTVRMGSQDLQLFAVEAGA
ncbi:GNAT family N-acetyltransferase [Lysobacter soli]|uniref:GNAT family N-acetyltransferase n=1 Tax=Lysobacter soli TaxID=453783 RepID=UPI0024102029|nr:GNAT family N-acetyltransferase [Lysobacter soli]MDG2517600.1 GNAT family N-acetyltransferase [Lysobacter soli]